MSLNDQPTSRRAARMLERERESTGATETVATTAEVAAGDEPTVEPVAETASEPARPVVSDAIFAGASWAAPIVGDSAFAAPAAATPAPVPETPSPAPVVAAPAAEAAPIVRRRDLRDRPAGAPPVDLTGEVAFDPAVLAGPRPAAISDPRPEPVGVAASAEAVPAEPVPAEPMIAQPVAAAEAVVEPTVAPDPAPEPAASVFAAPAPGSAPSWARPAAAATAPIEHSPVSRRARRAADAPIADGSAVVEAPLEAAPPVDATTVSAPAAAPVVAEAVAPTDLQDDDDEARTSTMPPRAAAAEPSAWTAPEGHWSRQLDADDVDEHLESTFSRSVGATSPTTNALVMPVAPPLDFSGPLSATGEIMLTGSIKLPDAFARTGATDHVDLADRDDLDDLFDDAPVGDFPADSQPIRAAAAVGGEHALGSPIVSTVKPGRGNKVLTGLLITACALAVVVTGLIITAFAVGIV